MRKSLSSLLLVAVLSACQGGYEEEQLHGRWVGVAVTEEGSPLAIDPSQIQLRFLTDQRYTYRSTLDYKEAGSYFIDANYLYTRDTLNQASTEKAVELLKLKEDSLRIRMLEGGKERMLTLVREK